MRIINSKQSVLSNYNNTFIANLNLNGSVFFIDAIVRKT